ncbi:MAG: helix-turn-helix domain-containing protein [Flavobacteriales bacterium]|jgi:transcriptional regulator with XRE-family HTH domain
MSIYHINNWHSLSDAAIVKELGIAIRQMRLQANLTQQEVATKAGLDRVTISKLENGASATLLTLIQILRVVDQLDVLNAFHEGGSTSPLQAAKLQGRTRQRVRNKKTDHPDQAW